MKEISFENFYGETAIRRNQTRAQVRSEFEKVTPKPQFPFDPDNIKVGLTEVGAFEGVIVTDILAGGPYAQLVKKVTDAVGLDPFYFDLPYAVSILAGVATVGYGIQRLIRREKINSAVEQYMRSEYKISS